MEAQQKRRVIGITVAVIAVCAGGVAIAATWVGGSGSGSTGIAPLTIAGSSAAPGGSAGGGLGGNLYNRGNGGGGYGGGGGGGFRGGAGGFAGSLGPAATYLGVTTSALQTDLQSGKTLAQVAKAQGKSVDGLIAAMVSAQKTQFDAAIKSGRVTAAQAQMFESLLKQRITDQVNGTRPSFGGRGGGFGGNDDGGGPGSSGSGSGSFGTPTA